MMTYKPLDSFKTCKLCSPQQKGNILNKFEKIFHKVLSQFDRFTVENFDTGYNSYSFISFTSLSC